MEESSEKFPPVTVLSKAQRRVLGVLVEKGLTVPDSYPMTLKALTTGCNQKNNRDPISDYSEDDVSETLDQLRQMGLIGVVHTESGRTERYRHYLRHRLPLSEPQIAILIELLLRGRQQPGELRSRAGRMAPIENQEALRSELQGLIERKLVQMNGPIDRRGVEVDHTLYKPNENRVMTPMADEPPSPPQRPAAASPAPMQTSASATSVVSLTEPPDHGRFAAIEAAMSQLKAQNETLTLEQESLREQLQALTDQVDELRKALGG